VKARKNEIEKAQSLMGVRRNSSMGEGRHFVYHFQITDDGRRKEFFQGSH